MFKRKKRFIFAKIILMKRLFILLILAVETALSYSAITYRNPILPYDYSDPDVCRVGNMYLMTSSSFNNIPGLQILLSEDLVHWDIVDAALPYCLPGFEPGKGTKVLGNFVWAPSIRTHADTLYIYYGDPDRGIYCVRAALPQPLTRERFPLHWEEAVLVMPAKGYIDACPFWDEDGRCYLVHGVAGSRRGVKSVLMMAELTADGLGVKVPSRIIFDGHEEHETSEGPKLYKKDGYYYIFHPAGGVEFGWQVVQRSRNIYGPYELQVVLRQGETAINGPHQGAYVETPQGEGWFFHFQDVGIAGRIVHLQPVRWENGWPVMGNNGEPVLTWGDEMQGDTWSHFAHRDEFDSMILGLDWQWAGGYQNPTWYFCDAAHSRLRLYSFPKGKELMENMLLQKIPYAAFTATCRVRFTPNQSPKLVGVEEAGLVVFGRKTFLLPARPGGWMYLRLEMDAQQHGQFFTSEDGEHWQTYGEPFRAVEGKWTGVQVGLYCTREDTRINDSGYLDVDWFEITTPNP